LSCSRPAHESQLAVKSTAAPSQPAAQSLHSISQSFTPARARRHSVIWRPPWTDGSSKALTLQQNSSLRNLGCTCNPLYRISRQSFPGNEQALKLQQNSSLRNLGCTLQLCLLHFPAKLFPGNCLLVPIDSQFRRFCDHRTMNHHEELTNDNEFADETFELQVPPGTYLVNSPEYSPSVSPISMATSTDTIVMRRGTDGILYTYDEFMEYYGFGGDDAWALADPRGPQQVRVYLSPWPNYVPLANRFCWSGQQLSEFVLVQVGIRYPVQSPYPSRYSSDDDESPLPNPMVLDSPQSPANE
jgi:hypothetical protein